MKAAPIHLRTYTVIELSFSANPRFDALKQVELVTEDFNTSHKLTSTNRESPTPAWQLVMRIAHRAGSNKNAPYNFTLELIGFFDVHPSVPKDKIEELLNVNGSSMLYGAAREIIRNATAMGPYLAILIPSVSFYPSQKKPESPPEEKTSTSALSE